MNLYIIILYKHLVYTNGIPMIATLLYIVHERFGQKLNT